MPTPEEILYSLPTKGHVQQPIARLGETVYFCINPYFVVDAMVTEVDFILVKAADNSPQWCYLFRGTNGQIDYWLPVPTDEKDPLGWTITRNATLTEMNNLQDYTIVNWEIDVDLPVGHSFWLEDSANPYGECYRNLSHALEHQRPFKHVRKRHRAEDLHNFIRRRKRFIASTHRKSVAAMNWPHYRRYEERNIYWRKK